MSDLRKAAEMALEALKLWDNIRDAPTWYGRHERIDAINALQQALEQPEQEPFIYVREDNERPFGGFEHCSEADVGAFPVYTAPMLYTPQPKRKWVGINEKEISWLWFWMGNREKINGYDFAKAIESKLKERNNG